MIRKYLDDIVLIAHSKNIRSYTDNFVKQWQAQLEDLGFYIDSEGCIIGTSKPILAYELKIMNEYIMLRCLFTHTANGFSADDRNYCRNTWERKNISNTSQQECKLKLNVISEKLRSTLDLNVK
jgi:hypothetical protein